MTTVAFDRQHNGDTLLLVSATLIIRPRFVIDFRWRFALQSIRDFLTVRTPLMRLVAAALLCAGAGCAPERYLRTAPLVGALLRKSPERRSLRPAARTGLRRPGRHLQSVRPLPQRQAQDRRSFPCSPSKTVERSGPRGRLGKKLRGNCDRVRCRRRPSGARPDPRIAGELAAYLEQTIDRAAVVPPESGARADAPAESHRVQQRHPRSARG